MEINQLMQAFNNFAQDMLNIKATEIMGKGGYTLDDIDDIKQELILDLRERLAKYDPDKADLKLFITCVLDRKAKNLVRHRESVVRDYRREECSLNEDVLGEDSDQLVERVTTISQDDQDLRRGKYRRSGEDRIQLQLDIEAVLADLPPQFRRAAELLQTMTLTEAARAMGVPRRTFREKHLPRLREIFRAKGMDLYLF